MEEAALALVIALLNNAGAISAALRQAHAEGRKLNAEDWAAIDARDDVAAAKQVLALELAKSEGR